SPDGTLLALGGSFETEKLRPHGVIKIWDLKAGKERLAVEHTQRPGVFSVEALAFSPDGKRLVTAGSTTVKLWDVGTGKSAGSFDDPRWAVHAAAFSPDGKTLAAQDAGGVVYLWDVPAATSLTSFHAHASDEQRCATVVFTPDGKQLLTGGKDKRVKVWD